MTSVRNRRKAAIEYLKRESAEWKDRCNKELTTSATREIGKVRAMLIEECLKILELMKRRG